MAEENKIQSLHLDEDYSLWLAELKSRYRNAQKLKQAASVFPKPFAFIGWTHHTVIIQKCKNIDEALYYILKTIENNWSREALKRAINADIYHTQAIAPNNFDATLVKPQAGLLQEIVKANYDFSWQR